MTGAIPSIRAILCILSRKTDHTRKRRVFEQTLARKPLIFKGSFWRTSPQKGRANVPFSTCKYLILLGPISR